MSRPESSRKNQVDDLVIVCSVFIHWDASDDLKIYENNYKATRESIQRAMKNEPTASEMLSEEGHGQASVFAEVNGVPSRLFECGSMNRRFGFLFPSGRGKQNKSGDSSPHSKRGIARRGDGGYQTWPKSARS